MGKIDYKKIYDYNRRKWEGLTDEPEKYEALLAGHYSDSNHFIYELLQNAEDADATKVVVECYADKLIFFHNGTPFNEDDVVGVSSMLMGTKSGKSDKDSGQKIGHFGMGFKSVFKYTNQPEVYSDEEAFKIERYLLPVELDNGWNYTDEKENIKCKLVGGKTRFPFRSEEHLTKFIIPFTKKDVDGNEVKLSSKDVISKLRELDGRILLFLSTIKELYWIDKTTNEFMLITLSEDEQDKNLITCRREGSRTGEKEDIEKYLKFTKVFDHEKMNDCNVSIAYKVNRAQGKLHIAPLQNQCVWVYFPTKDETVLPFLIHGSFETAVSREKLMEPSAFNNDLFGEIINLIGDSLEELKSRGMITQSFIRQVLIPAFDDERFNLGDCDDNNGNEISDLQVEITKRFKEGELLPTTDGGYCSVSKAFIPVPYGMAEFKKSELFKDSFGAVNTFVQFGDNSAARFNDYYIWLRDDLGVPLFTLESWGKQLQKLSVTDRITKKSSAYSELKQFYDFISDYRESVYVGKSQAYFSRTSSYEMAIRNCVKAAWEHFRTAPIVLNKTGDLIPAYVKENTNIYLNSSSKFKSVVVEALVEDDLVKDFKLLFEEGLRITPFNNFQFVKEKVIRKYVDGDEINFENESNSDQEYLEDLKQILNLVSEGVSVEELQDMLKDACIVRVVCNGEVLYSLPSQSYRRISDEGVDLTIYMNAMADDYSPLDYEFYEKNQISDKQLGQLGVFSKIEELGTQRHNGGQGDPAWYALGDYYPQISILHWKENRDYISENPDTDLAKKKSKEMLTWALRNSSKLAGEVKHNKTNTYIRHEESRFLRWDIKGEYPRYNHYGSGWLYNQNEELVYPEEISKFELNTAIYGPIEYSKESYEVLGFATKNMDETADAFDAVDSMDKKSKEVLFKQLARSLGYTVEKSNSNTFIDDEEDGLFDPNSMLSNDFPTRRVKNMDTLQAHVRQQFFCSDPTKYRQVLRQIRVSKNQKMVKEYVSSMYTNIDGVRICQMCKEPAQTMEAIEIAHLGIEMEQLHLGLCPNCAAKYKALRDNEKNKFKENVIEDIRSIDLEFDEEDGEYELCLSYDESIWFNQTHLAEIQEILSLVEQHGLPGNSIEEVVEEGPLGPITRRRLLLPEEEVAVTEEKKNVDSYDAINDVLIIEEGCFVTYKKLALGKGESSCYDNVIQSKKYPLHKALIGAKVGDVIRFMGKDYEVMAIIPNENN